MTTTQMTATKTARRLSPIALCARDVRATLKANFDGVTFSVWGTGESVHVSWVDGPSADDVNEVVACFRQGAYDGSVDSYVARPAEASVTYRAMFIFVERSVSDVGGVP